MIIIDILIPSKMNFHPISSFSYSPQWQPGSFLLWFVFVLHVAQTGVFLSTPQLPINTALWIVPFPQKIIQIYKSLYYQNLVYWKGLYNGSKSWKIWVEYREPTIYWHPRPSFAHEDSLVLLVPKVKWQVKTWSYDLINHMILDLDTIIA